MSFSLIEATPEDSSFLYGNQHWKVIEVDAARIFSLKKTNEQDFFDALNAVLANENELTSEKIASIIQEKALWDSFEPYESNQSHAIHQMGMADATWMLGSALCRNFAPYSLIFGISASIVWPVGLGCLACKLYESHEILKLWKEKERKPTPSELKKIKQDAWALGAEITASVAGWEVGFEVGKRLFREITQQHPLLHLAVAAMIGTMAALSALFMKLYNERSNPNKNYAAIGSMVLSTFFTAACWYGISIIPINGTQHLIGGGINRLETKLTVSASQSLLAYTSVRTGFWYKSKKYPTQEVGTKNKAECAR